MSTAEQCSTSPPACDDQQRLEALRRYAILDTPPEQAFDDITRLIAHICEAPVAVINLIDSGRQWFKSEVGLGVRQTPLDVSICVHGLLQRDLFIVPDTTQDERFRNNPLVTGEPRLRFYAGALLESPDGHPIGTLCVLDHRPRELSEPQKDALRALARQVMGQLELRRVLAEQARLLEQQRQTEAALRQGEQRFRATFEQTAVGMAHAGPDGRFLLVNPTFCRNLGYTADELTSRTFLDVTHPDDREPTAEQVRRVLAGEAPLFQMEKRYVRKDGSVMWGNLSVSLVRTPDGAPEFFVGVIEDVTRRRRTEDELRQSEARLAAVIDTSLDCIVAMDHQGRVTEWNAAAERTFGYARDEVVGREMASLIVPPALRGDHRRGLAGFLATGRGPVLGQRLELTAVRKDGSEFPVELAIAPIRTDGPPGFTGFLRDLTDRKRAEEVRRMIEMRFQRLVEQSPLSIQIFSPDGTVRQVNKAWEQLWGITVDDVPGYNILLDPQLEAQGATAMIRRAFAGEPASIPPVPYVLDRGAHKGRTQWVGAFIYPVKDDAGRVEEVVLVHEDVTESRLAQEALRRSEQRLRSLIDQSAAGIAQTDLTGRILFANDRFCQIVGYPAEELVGRRRVHDLTHPDDLPRTAQLVAGGAATGNEYGMEKRYVRRDGSVVWAEVTASVMKDGAGSPESIMGVVIDVTARKQAEAAVREREALLRSFLDNAPSLMGVVEVAADGSDILHVLDNAATERFFGAAGGATAGLWSRRHLGASQETVREWAAAYIEAKLIGQPVRFHHRIEGDAGAAAEAGTAREAAAGGDEAGGRWLDVAVSYVGTGDGGRDRFCYTALDDTDRRRMEEALRQSERRLAEMADAMPQMVWVTRPDGHHEYYNRRWYEFTGASAGSTDGRGWSDMFHPDDRDRAWQAWRHSLETGEPYEIEYRLQHHTGDYRWTLGRALPVRDDRGRIERWIGTCTDIDALKQLMGEREHLLNSERAARGEAERASRLKDEFLATVSHELRTPLNAILGYAQLLRRVVKEATAADGLEVIERNARVQGQLIEDILDMSRIVSGKMRLDVQQVDLPDVVGAALETVRPAADAKEIRLGRTVDPSGGPVSGDPGRLQQVVWNLLTNAVKFTPKGGRVHVTLRRVDSHVEVAVSDTGKGIGPEFLPHVFDKFRQADGATTRQFGGLGLGLSIVKSLVEMHGGTIRADSAGDGRGATFTVSLPLPAVHAAGAGTAAGDDDAAPDAGAAAAFSPVRDRPSLDGVTVLAVDDERDSRELVRRLLEECGAKVVTAGSAAEAIAALDRERVDVLLSDIGMPGADGYDLVRRLRARGPGRGGDIPAAALTAFARSEDRTRALMAGFQTHIAKPVESVELLFAVASLARRTGRY